MPQTVLAVIPAQPSGGGTTSNPYLIATDANLLWFADQVNNVHNTSICAKLTADITLWGPTDNYVIGTNDYGFKGEFDGDGHTISGVKVISPKTSNNGYQYAGGLFGCLKASTSETAVVKNLTVAGSVSISGLTVVYYIGGVIGVAYGNVNVSNVTSRVDVTTLSESQDAHCGGIVASVEWFGNGNYSGNLTVSNCVNYGTLDVACGEICGGIVGYIRNGSISDCLNVGNITNSENGTTAGILGYVNSTGCTMTRCLNVGTVTNTNTQANAYSVYYKKSIGTISDLYYKSGTAASTSANTTAISDANLKNGNLGYTFATDGWGQSIGNNSVNDAYPIPNKADYKVYQTGSNYYNNITSTIPTGGFATTIETTAQYITNQTRIGDTKSFNVTANTGKYISTVKHNGITLSPTSINNNVKTYSYSVALTNTFEITTANIACTTTFNQSTIGTAINLTDNTVGSTETFTVTPNTGYYITGATINGVTIAGTAVSGKTDGTKSYSFTVQESNTVVINTAAIPCTTTLNQSTSTLDLADNQIGSTDTFTVTPKAGYYITGATINGESVSGTDTEGQTNGTKSFSFTVKEGNMIYIHTAAIACTTTLNQSTSTLNLADNQIGSTETFTVTPKAGYYITGATINGEIINATSVSGKTDGTKSFSFTVKESNTVIINTAAIAYTKPAAGEFTTTLPNELTYKQMGSTVNFTIAPTDGNHVTTVSHNATVLTPTSIDADRTVHYSFVVDTENTISVSTEECEFENFEKGFCPICGAREPATLNGYYYEIDNAGKLYWFAEKVNGSNNTFIPARLTADIVVNENVLTADGELNGDGDGFRVWTPIGYYGKGYSGIFDGQGYTISGLYFNNIYGTNKGLFGYISGDIKNVGVVDSYFHGYEYVGGVCGDCSSGTITNCYNTGVVRGHDIVGGVCGDNHTGKITNCYNTGVVSGQQDNVGGVCGKISYGGTITNCYYLKDTSSNGIGEGSGEATEKTAEQFKSGEVAWLLNGGTTDGTQAWYQALGQNGDSIPVLISTTHNTVYKDVYPDCEATELSYGNDPLHTTPGHSFAEGKDVKCGYCDTWRLSCVPGRLNSLVRPYAGTLTGDAALYDFCGIKDDALYGDPVEDKAMAAGHPYLLKPETGCQSVYFKAGDTSVELTQAEVVNGLHGVLTSEGVTIEASQAEPCVVFTNNGLKYLAWNTPVTLGYGRGYIDLNEAEAAYVSAPAAAYVIGSVDGQATDLDGVGSDDEQGRAYNLMGVQVGDDYKGMVIRNGKKYIQK